MKTPDLKKLDKQELPTLQAQLNLHAMRLRATLSATAGETIQPPKLVPSAFAENIALLIEHISELEHRVGDGCPQVKFPAAGNFPNAIGENLTIGELYDAGVSPRLSISANDLEDTAQPDHQQIGAIARELGFTVPESVIEAVNKLDERFMSVAVQFEKHTDRAALEDFRNHSQARDEKILSTEDVSHHTGINLEDFKRIAREKLMASKQLMQNHGKDTFEICRPHLQRFADLVSDHADQRALWEVSRCQKYGFPWKPSDTVLRLYRAAKCVEKRLEDFSATSGQRPKVVADFIFDLAEQPT